MKDFSKIIGQDMQDIRRGLESARLTTVTPDAPQNHMQEMQEGIERRAGKRALADMRFAQATGMSAEHLAANRATAITAPGATPGQAQGKGAGLQL